MGFQLARCYSFTKWPTFTSSATLFLVRVRHPFHNLCPFHANRWCPDYCHIFITAGCATNRPPGMLTTTLTLRPVRRGPKAHGWLASRGLHTISNRFTLLSHGRQAGDIKRRNAGVVCLVRRRCGGGHFSSRHLLAAGSVAGDASRFSDNRWQNCVFPHGGRPAGRSSPRGWAIKLLLCVLKYETSLSVATSHVYVS